jgi:hypothetical protein
MGFIEGQERNQGTRFQSLSTILCEQTMLPHY